MYEINRSVALENHSQIQKIVTNSKSQVNYIMNNITFGSIVFGENDNQFWIKKINNFVCSQNESNSTPTRASGLFVVKEDHARHDGEEFLLFKKELTKDRMNLLFRNREETLEIESKWLLYEDSQVISRQDKLTNISDNGIVVKGFLSRFAFSHGEYDIYSQQSRWGRENQGDWSNLSSGTLRLGTRWGRTSEGGTPFAAIRERYSQGAIAFHIVPKGNWTMLFQNLTVFNSIPMMILELGQSDMDMNWPLAAGETLIAPEILIQPLKDKDIHSGTADIHQVINKRSFAPVRNSLPVSYNCWLDKMDVLEVPRLRRQLSGG
jgi:alpha-galactosidase